MAPSDATHGCVAETGRQAARRPRVRATSTHGDNARHGVFATREGAGHSLLARVCAWLRRERRCGSGALVARHRLAWRRRPTGVWRVIERYPGVGSRLLTYVSPAPHRPHEERVRR